MKSYSIQQKPCQVIAEGCSYQLQRYKNNLKKQMILQENRKIDRNRLHPAQNNWRKSHSRFYSSLFTKSAETPINTGGVGGEEWWFTLHHSSPLFTLIIFLNASYKQWFGHLLWPAPIIYYDQLQPSKMTELRNKVKSGEEWVKSCLYLFTPRNPSVYGHFRASGEEWRVSAHSWLSISPLFRFRLQS